jgi:uncharacterized Fe-S cluster-containing radical SAM superfamily protein
MNINDIKTHVGLNVTRRCNLKCKFCYYGKLYYAGIGNTSISVPDGTDLPLNLAKERLSQLNLGDVYLCGGEPLTYPYLRELINWLLPRSGRIYIATNGLLLDESWISFFSNNDICCLISVKNNSQTTYKKIKQANDNGVKVHIYHVLTLTSEPILKTLAKKYLWAERIRLLYGTPSENNAMDMFDVFEWYGLLKLACDTLASISEKVDVEMAFVPSRHPFAVDVRKGAVKRFYMDVNGLVYSCPLLVEKSNGETGLEPRDCNIDTECPVLSKKMTSSNNYTQICPFVLANLDDVGHFLDRLDWVNLSNAKKIKIS